MKEALDPALDFISGLGFLDLLAFLLVSTLTFLATAVTAVVLIVRGR